MNLLEQPIGQLACAMPGATRVFHRYGLDFCCGGHKTLREAAEKRDVDPLAVAAELETLRNNTVSGRDWREAPVADLVEHILTRFHARHREQLPEMIRLARRVEQVHAERDDCPAGLADHLDVMHNELLSHMMKEEQVLFPMLLGEMGNRALAPIAMMRFEHDHHGDALARLLVLTDDITAPADACTTWRALYAGLLELKEDLMEHIHLENNILFLEVEQAAASA